MLPRIRQGHTADRELGMMDRQPWKRRQVMGVRIQAAAPFDGMAAICTSGLVGIQIGVGASGIIMVQHDAPEKGSICVGAGVSGRLVVVTVCPPWGVAGRACHTRRPFSFLQLFHIAPEPFG